MIFLLLALTSFAAQPWEFLPNYPQIGNETKVHASEYVNCIITKSGEYESSGEPSQIVASAAITACRDGRTKLEASLYVDCVGLRSAPCPKNIKVEDIMTNFDRLVRAEALREVIEVRSSRKAH